jgi:hypothetical protein
MRVGDFPATPELISSKFLTSILRQSGLISRGTSVKDFTWTKLKGSLSLFPSRHRENRISNPAPGGVHFHVVQAVLNYESTTEVDATSRPKSVVVKMINGGDSMSIWLKMLLWIRLKWSWFAPIPASVEELAYRLKGYKIETRFYRHYAHQVAIPVPRCFYNYEDLYRVRFLMVLEDLSPFETGEPDGFTQSTSKLLMENLAVLHAEFWKAPFFHEPAAESIKPSIWTFGGYWFGNKEMPHGKSLKACWDKMLASFPEQKLDVVAGESFGANMDAVVEQLTTAVHKLTPRTMVHGDYKISNLFVNVQKPKSYTIDWQWMGGGCPATDVAYFIYTSTDIPLLKEPIVHPKYPFGKSELDLLKCYHDSLVRRGIKKYSFDDFAQQYMLNVMFFAVFCMRAKYSNMDPEEVLRYKRHREDGLHLRSFEHMKFLLAQASKMEKLVRRSLEGVPSSPQSGRPGRRDSIDDGEVGTDLETKKDL